MISLRRFSSSTAGLITARLRILNSGYLSEIPNADLKFYITEEILGFLAFQVGPTGDSYQGVGLYVRYKDDYKKYFSLIYDF